MEDITLLQVFAACWITTWYLTVVRTWKLIKHNVYLQAPRLTMSNKPGLHFFVYSLSINLMLPFIGFQVCFSDDMRDRWVIAYVNAFTRKNK